MRQAITEMNQAGNSQSDLVRKGAEITQAFLPNMLLRSPSLQERLMSTRKKMDTRFAKFFAAQFPQLVEDISLSSAQKQQQDGIRIPRSHVFSKAVFNEKAVLRAERFALEGQIRRAANTL